MAADVEVRMAADGSRKYRFPLEDGLSMEAAYFHVPGRERPDIACVSTQLGCAVGCPFCAAARHGLYRNLTAGEIEREVTTILDQALAEGRAPAGFEVSFMGMGEPLANLDALLDARARLHRRYPAMTRMSVSTAGPAPRIDALTGRMPVAPPLHLQISLHATDDRTRHRLVPHAPGSIASLLEAGRRYHEVTGDHVCLNYVLLRGLNDRAEDADRLCRLDGRVWYVKVTELNPTADQPGWIVGASRAEIARFCDRLRAGGMPHKVFFGDGLDVSASCGQLAARPVEVVVD